MNTGVLSLGVPWHPQILADQLTQSQPRGADYAHQLILAPQISRPSDGPGEHHDMKSKIRALFENCLEKKLWATLTHIRSAKVVGLGLSFHHKILTRRLEETK